MDFLDGLMTLILHGRLTHWHGPALAQLLGGLGVALGGLGLWASHLFADVTENTVGGASLALTVAGLITAATAFWKNRDDGKARLEQIRTERERLEREDARKARELDLREREIALEEGMSADFREYVNVLRKNYALARRKHPSLPEMPDMPAMPAAWYRPTAVSNRTLPPSQPKPPSQTIPVTKPAEPGA